VRRFKPKLFFIILISTMSLDFNIIEFDIINPFNTSTPLTLLILEMF
jgi:hypothetical protein